MVKTIVDLERNNWELLRKKIKEGAKISIKIPKNIDEYKYSYARVRYNFVNKTSEELSASYDFAKKTEEEKIYDLDENTQITLKNIDNEKPKLPLLYKRSNGSKERFYIEIDNIDGTKWVKITRFDRMHNEWMTNGCYKGEDVNLIFTHYKPTEEDKQRSKLFLKSLDEFIEEVKSQPPGETNYPFSSEYYLTAKERNKTLFRKSPSTSSKQNGGYKKYPSKKKKTNYKIRKTLKTQKYKSYKEGKIVVK